MTPDEAIAKLRTLPEEKQRQVLLRLSPDERKGILTKLKSPAAEPAQVATPAQHISEGSTATKIATGAALGAFEGLGIPASTDRRQIIEGTFKNLSQGAKDLLVQTWDANAPKSKLGKELDTPISHAARTAVDVIPTFIINLADSIEHGGRDFMQAVQQKDWARAAEVASSNVTQLATLRGAVEHPEAAPEKAEKSSATLREKAQSFGRQVTEAKQGAKSAVEDAIEKRQKDIAKNKEERRSIMQENMDKLRRFNTDIDREKLQVAEDNRRIEAENKAQAELVQKRAQLARTVDQESATLGKEIDRLENSVWKEANSRMDAVKPKGNPESDPSSLISTVRGVEDNVLQGVPENIKEFRRVLSMEGTSDELAKLRQDVMAGQGMSGKYEDLPPERKALVDDITKRLGTTVDPNEPLTWGKLQALKSRLDARLRNTRGMNGDLKRALMTVHAGVVDEMGKLLEKSNPPVNVKDWQSARDFYRQFKEDFHEPTGPSGSGSPVAKSLDALDPANIRRPFSATQSAIGNRGVETLRKYKQFGGDQVAAHVEQILKTEREMEGLPKEIKSKPFKQAKEVHEWPPRKQAPSVPEKPTVDIEQAARDKIQATATRIGRLNVWDARIIMASTMAGVLAPFLGVKEAALVPASYVALKLYLSKTLEKPKIVDWLARTPQAELDSLKQLPGADQVNIKHGITEAAIELSKRRKLSISPELRRFLGPSNIARIAAVNSAVQKERTKRPADQIKDLRAIQQRYTSNPAMPVGANQ